MFNVLRCPKCNHVIIGQDDFIKTITERINTNLIKLKKARHGERQPLLQENAMYLCYMKQVLHNQYNLKYAELRDTAMLKEVINYCIEHGLLNKEVLGELSKKADKKRERQAADISKKLEQLYGDFGSYCSNVIKPDPTAQQAFRNLG